ncbi:BgTH12-05479 [Blumeria graminis f. sp. triticale]|uniref:BgTH12-05479 n=1 Tax=Blumeria graminis f. sp. triticale TaxID=1689686 RepID=A0A9W4D436_BLUGR|nr:BgTH12-05479 [Blumeria graminis f. sp. triticale]
MIGNAEHIQSLHTKYIERCMMPTAPISLHKTSDLQKFQKIKFSQLILNFPNWILQQLNLSLNLIKRKKSHLSHIFITVILTLALNCKLQQFSSLIALDGLLLQVIIKIGDSLCWDEKGYTQKPNFSCQGDLYI